MSKRASLVFVLLAIMASPVMAVDRVVSIPDGIAGVLGEVATAPVNLNDATDLLSFDLAISYDTDLLDLGNADVKAGSLTSGWSITKLIDEAAGTVTIAANSSSGDPLVGGTGSVLTLDFHVITAPGTSALTFLSTQGLGTMEGYIKPSYDDGSINVVPEPSTLVLLLGSMLFAVIRRRNGR